MMMVLQKNRAIIRRAMPEEANRQRPTFADQARGDNATVAPHSRCAVVLTIMGLLQIPSTPWSAALFQVQLTCSALIVPGVLAPD